MIQLDHIIRTLSSEEQMRFITYLEQKNKRKGTKNIQLFKYLAKTSYSSNELVKLLYKSNKSNAYHALRKRLYKSLIDFIANLRLEDENTIDMQITKYILASRSILIHKQYKVAYDVLEKAEELAIEHHSFTLLNEIYNTKIQYAYLNTSINLDVLINKLNKNQDNLSTENQLNIVYSKVRQTLNDITYKGQILNFENILNSILKEHNISLNDTISFKSLYQLISIVSISAFITNDYLQIEPFLLTTYKSLQSKEEDSKQTFYHIHILYHIANTLFRNKKFDKSLYFLGEMFKYMNQKDKKYFSVFKLKYHLLLALNFNFIGKQSEAIKTLEPYINKKYNDIEALLDIHLSLVMMYFQKGDFKKAFSIFSKFYHTDKWYIEKVGKDWVLKKRIIELLLHIELENIDLVESRFLSFKRAYYNYLKQINQERAITYLQFVELYFKNPEYITSKEFKEKVNISFKWVDARQEDIFVMSFYAWLKSKMDKTSLYNTTLQIVESAGALKLS